jgi:hypothetical protein
MYVELGDQHHPTGNTRHTLVDSQGARPFPSFIKLEISKYEGDEGYYLLYYTTVGQGTDTWHESLENAQHQAEFEFRVRPDEWVKDETETQ